MPGILPMKMIRVGSSSQSRIAQACDRCRSKKIRCDGIRPCCSQCSNVGFECKTSDKLSRRAFPRGYTESLEDRVRGLEAEVRELKQLLDEKDEKIDMLSRIHSFSPISRKSPVSRNASASLSPNTAVQVKAEVASNSEDLLHVEIPAPVEPACTSPGSSTTSALIEAFECKVQEQGRNCPKISPVNLLSPSTPSARATPYATHTSVAPPRLLSDQYINLYFQEWQPLLPVLHRHTFLRVYEQFLSSSDSGPSNNKIATAQLFLIFEIAAHSASSKAKPNTATYELEWRKALSSVSSAPSLDTLQCHVLAQLCYLLKADYPHLLRHRAHAVSLSHQLGLHQAHKCHYLPTFEAETRKKVFWCQYALDKFASAATGMPTLMRDIDITADWPAEVDDENINSQGVSPALPGEITKMSSALSVFKMSKILSKTLEHLYPASASYSLSITKLHSLSDELDQWHEELPDHLRLRFCNDKPATNMISDRSLLLSLGYFFIRSLIHRPLLCHGSGSAASAATIVLAAAGKHILQIIDLLDERSMNYTFPINKQDVLISAGFSIFWQCLDLDEDSKLVKDNQKSLNLLLTKLTKENNSAGREFQKIAAQFVPAGNIRGVPSMPRHIDVDLSASRTLDSMPAPPNNKQKTAKKQLQAIASCFPGFSGKTKPDESSRRATVPATVAAISPHPRTGSAVSLASTQSAPAMQICTPSPKATPAVKLGSNAASAINLDYFPFDAGLQATQPSRNSSATMLPPNKRSSPASHNSSWEHLVTDLDCSGNILHTVSPIVLNKTMSNPETLDWTNDMWQLGAFNTSPKAPVTQSLLSFSEESLTSGDDFMFSAPGSHNGSMSTHDGLDASVEETYKGITMPVSNEDDLDFSQTISG